MVDLRIVCALALACGCRGGEKETEAPDREQPVAKTPPPAKADAVQCAPPGTVVDGKTTPPTPAMFGAPGAGPPELARLHEPMPLADAKCLSPDVFAYDAARKELAAGVGSDITISGDTLTERGLALTAPAIAVLREAWGPDDHGCWFAADHRHRACVIEPSGSYPWGQLRLDDYVPLAEQLGTTPGSLADVPRLVGVPMRELEGGPRRGFVASQPPGSPPPGKIGDMILWATEWGYTSTIRLFLAADDKLTVTGAYLELGYRGMDNRKAILDLLSARWGGGEPATTGPKDTMVIHAKDPAITVTEGAGTFGEEGTLAVSID